MKELKPSGLIAVPIIESAKSFNKKFFPVRNDIDSRDTYRLYVNDTYACHFSFDFEIIGFCTADEISFDVEPYTNATGLQGKEIFMQILKANGVLFVNPYGEKAPVKKEGNSFDNINWLSAFAEWQQAESQLVKKVLILKPINK